MIKVTVSVMMEFTADWQQHVADFQEKLRTANIVNEQGEIRIPSYAYLENIFEIARACDIAVILHS